MNALPKKLPSTEYLSTLERGLRVLRAFDQQNPEMQLSEVAAKTGLSPAVARRCLNTLVELGYVGQYGRKFLLRPEVLAFGSAFLSSMNLEQIVLPHLQVVRDETGDSSSLTVLSGHDILYLVHVSTRRHIRLGANVGTRFPAFATSLGRVLLAFQTETFLDRYFAEADFPKLTENTVTGKQTLRSLLSQVREQGYSATQDELDYGIISVAVPVFGPDGTVVAAINCSTSTTRVARDVMVQTRLPALSRAAREIGQQLARMPFLLHSLSA